MTTAERLKNYYSGKNTKSSTKENKSSNSSNTTKSSTKEKESSSASNTTNSSNSSDIASQLKSSYESKYGKNSLTGRKDDTKTNTTSSNTQKPSTTSTISKTVGDGSGSPNLYNYGSNPLNLKSKTSTTSTSNTTSTKNPSTTSKITPAQAIQNSKSGNYGVTTPSTAQSAIMTDIKNAQSGSYNKTVYRSDASENPVITAAKNLLSLSQQNLPNSQYVQPVTNSAKENIQSNLGKAYTSEDWAGMDTKSKNRAAAHTALDYLKENNPEAYDYLSNRKQTVIDIGVQDKLTKEYGMSGADAAYWAKNFDTMNGIINSENYEIKRSAALENYDDEVIEAARKIANNDVNSLASTLYNQAKISSEAKKYGIDRDEFAKLVQYVGEVDDEAWTNEQMELLDQFMTGNDTAAGNIAGTTIETFATWGASPIAGIMALGELVKRPFYADKDAPLNTNSGAFYFSNAADQIAESATRDSGDTATFLYNAGVSTASSMLSMLLGQGATSALNLTGKAANVVGQVVTLPSFGASAYASTLTDMQEKGMGNEQAQATAIIAGIAEMAFEEISLDKAYSVYDAAKAGKKVWYNYIIDYLASAGIEGSEEVCTDIANAIADGIVNGDFSDYESNVRDYIAAGKSEDEAHKLASADFAKQLAESFAAGALSGATSNVLFTGYGHINRRNLANSVASNTDQAAALRESTLNNAPEDSTAYRIASENETLSSNNVFDIMGSLQEIDMTEEDLLKNTFVEMGETEEQATADAQKVLEMASEDSETITEEQSDANEQAINENENLANVYADYATGRLATPQQVAERTYETNYQAKAEARAEENAQKQANNTEAEIKDKQSKSKLGITGNYDGKIVSIDSFADVDQNHATMNTSAGVIDSTDLALDNSDMSRLIKAAPTLFENTAASNNFVKLYKGQNTATYARMMSLAFRQGQSDLPLADLLTSKTLDVTTGLDTMRESDPMDVALRTIYENGVATRQKAENATLSPYAENLGQTVNVAENDALKGIKDLIAHATSLMVTTSYTETIENGSFSAERGILSTSSSSDNEMDAISHEFGEFIGAYNAEGKEAFNKSVLSLAQSELGAEHVKQQIERYMYGYREAGRNAKTGVMAKEATKTYQEATDEYVNDFIAGMLGREDGAREWVNHLVQDETMTEQEKDSAIKTFGDFIQHIIDSIKSFIDKYHNAGTVDALKIDEKKLENLRKQLFAEYDKAKAEFKRQAAALTGETETKAEQKETKAEQNHQITIGMTDEQRYNALKDQTITISEYDSKAMPLSNEELLDIENSKMPEVKKRIVSMAENLGIFDKKFSNDQVEFEFQISKNGARESVQRQYMDAPVEDKYSKLAKVFTCIDNVVDNAILISALTEEEYYKLNPDHKKNEHITSAYTFISAYAEDENIQPIRLTILNYNDNNVGKIHILMALPEIEKARIYGKRYQNDTSLPPLANSDYRLADILAAVKNNPDAISLGKYIPEQFAKHSETGKNKTNLNEAVAAAPEKKNFSLNVPVEKTKELVAIHNLSEDKLLKMLQLDGIPMPSIAITAKDLGWTEFGDISLVFGKDTIDPKANRFNSVFGGDAWTATFPKIEVELDEKKIKELSYSIYNNLKDGPKEFMRLADNTLNDLTSSIEYYGVEEGAVKRCHDNYGFKALYLAEKGIKIPSKTMEVTEKRTDYEMENDRWILDNFDIDKLLHESVDDAVESGDFEKIVRYLLNKKGKDDTNINSNSKIQRYIFENSIINASDYSEKGEIISTKTVEDIEAEKKIVDDNIDEEGFNKWLHSQFDNIVAGRGVYNGKTYITDSGNRRTFKQLHYEVSAANIVKSMLAQGLSVRDVGSFKGITSIRNNATTEFKSIDQMHEEDYRLTQIDSEEYQAYVDSLGKRLADTMQSVVEASNRREQNPFILMDNMGENLLETISNPTVENIYKTLKGYRWNVTYEQCKEFQNIISECATMPVNMFEAKPQRVVGFGEIKFAAVPSNTSEKLINRLDAYNIPHISYEAGNSESRKAAVNTKVDEDNLAFSINIKDKTEYVDQFGKTIPVIENLKFKAKDFSTEEKAKSVFNYVSTELRKLSGQQVTVKSDNSILYFDKYTASEYIGSNDTKNSFRSTKAIKMNAAPEIKSIVENADKGKWSANVKGIKEADATRGVKHYRTQFAIPDGEGKYDLYKGTIIARCDKNGKDYVYDLLNVDIKKEGITLNKTSTGQPKAPTIPSLENNIPNNNKPVNNVSHSINIDSNGNKLTAEDDQKYLETVENNDMYRAGKLVADAAIKWGAVADPKYSTGLIPLKLYHGTGNFGFTVFDMNQNTPSAGMIYLTNKTEVSANYAGRNHYAFTRAIGKKYVENATSAKDIIQNAETVYGTRYHLMTESEKEAAIADLKKQASDIADRLDATWNELPQIDIEDFDNKFAMMIDMFWTIRDADSEYDTYYSNLQEDVEWYNNYHEEIRQAFIDNRDQFTNTGDDSLYKLITGYDLSDTAIDVEYKYVKYFSGEQLATNDKGTIRTLEELKNSTDEAHKVGSYVMYANLGDNPLIIDANRRMWTNVVTDIIKDDNEKDHNYGHKTDIIAKAAREQGYTSVVIKNVADGGETADDYILFNASQVKSADPVTYDDNGNVIPLSERFNSENEDIRYSLDISSDDEIEDLIDDIDWSEALNDDMTSDEEFDSIMKLIKKMNSFRKTSDSTKSKKKTRSKAPVEVKEALSNDYEYSGSEKIGFTNERIDTLLSSSYFASGNPKYARAYIAYMSPSDFLKLTTGKKQRLLEDVSKWNTEANGEFDKEKFASEFNEHPIYLDLNEDKDVIVDHNGRHRMVVLENAGIKQVPVLIFNDSEKSKYSKTTRTNVKIMPQSFYYEDKFKNSDRVTIKEMIPFSSGNRDLIKQKFGEGNNAGVRFSVNIDPFFDAFEEIDQDIQQGEAVIEKYLSKWAALDTPVGRENIKKIAKNIKSKYNSNIKTEDLTRDLTSVFKHLKDSGSASMEDVMTVMREVARPVLDNIKQADAEQEKIYNDFVNTVKTYNIALNTEQMQEVANGFGTYNEFKRAMAGKMKLDRNGTYLDDVWTEICDASNGMLSYGTNTNDQPIALANAINSLNPTYYNMDGSTKEDAATDLALEIFRQFFVTESMSDAAEELAGKMQQRSQKMKDRYKSKLKEAMKLVEAERAINIERLAREIDDLTAEEQDAIAKGDTINKALLEQMRLRYMERYKKLQQQADHKVAQAKANYQNSWIDKNIRREKSDLKKRLVREVTALQNMIAHPQEGASKHVPIQLVKATINMLESINLDNGGRNAHIVERLAKLAEVYNQFKGKEYEFDYDERLADNIAELQDMFTNRSYADLSVEELQRVIEIIQALKTQIKNANNLILENEHKDAVAAAEEAMLEVTSRKRLNNAAAKQLNKYVNLHLNAYREFRKLSGYKDGMLMSIYDQLDEGSMKEMQIQKDLGAIFQDVLEGADNQKEIKKFISTKPDDLVDVGLTDEKGNPVKVTRAMRMSLIMHSQNSGNMRHIIGTGINVPNMEDYAKGKFDDAYASDHIYRYAESKAIVEAIRQNDTAAVEQLTKAIQTKVEGLKKDLSPWELKFLADAEQLFHDETGKLINETALKLKGYAIARVKNYFPIRVDKHFTGSTNWSGLVQDGSLEGMGMLKERVISSKPILLEDITNVITRQIGNVSKYAGLAIPIRNFEKVMNLIIRDDQGNMNNLYQKIDAISGSTSDSEWLKNLMQDLQGGRHEKGDFFMHLRGQFAGATLTLNPSVAIKQAASYPTAAAIVGYKPLGKAMADMSKGFVKQQGLEELEKINPLLWYRNQGNATQELADAKAAGFGKNLPLWMQKAINWTQWMDTGTVRTLEYASMYYVDEAFPKLAAEKNTEKGKIRYWNKVSEIFSKVVEETQPNYSTLQKADIIRNPNRLIKQLVMFKTQPMQNFGILYDAFAELNAAKLAYKDHVDTYTKAKLTAAKDKASKALTSQVISAAVFSAMTILAQLLLHRVYKYRDDDDKWSWEEFFGAFGEGILSTMAGALLGGSELYDMIKYWIGKDKTYYGVEVSIVEMINDLAENTGSIIKASNSAFSAKTSTDRETALKSLVKSTLSMASTVGEYTGIPVNNIKNMFLSMFYYGQDAITSLDNGVFNISSNYDPIKAWDVKTQYERIYEALRDGDTDRYNRLVEEMKADALADEDNKAALKAGTMTEDEITAKVEENVTKNITKLIKADADTTSYEGLVELSDTLKEAGKADTSDTINDYLKENLTSGDMTEDEVQRYLEEEEGKAEADAYFQVGDWEYGKDTDYANLYMAMNDIVDGGDDVAAVTKAASKLVEYGKDKSNIRKQLKTYYAETYKDLYAKNKAANLHAALLKALVTIGFTEDEAKETLTSWRS